MPATFTHIATATGSGSTAISFTSISASYSDLFLIVSARSSYTAGMTYLTVAPNSTNFTTRYGDNYDDTTLRVNSTAISFMPVGYASDIYSAGFINIINYSDTGKDKSALSMAVVPNPGSTTSRISSHWSGGPLSTTSAVSSISIGLQNDNWGSETKISLYGILRA